MGKNFRQLRRPQSVVDQLESWAGANSNRDRRKLNALLYRSPGAIASWRKISKGFKRFTSSGKFVAYHHGTPMYY